MPKILFCCKHNRCRSRMAEALAKAHYPSWTIESAGSAPTGDVDPYAKAIVEELGLAVSSQAQSVNNLPLETYDLIVTLCSDEDICASLLPASVEDSSASCAVWRSFSKSEPTCRRRFNRALSRRERPTRCVLQNLRPNLNQTVHQKLRGATHHTARKTDQADKSLVRSSIKDRHQSSKRLFFEQRFIP